LEAWVLEEVRMQGTGVTGARREGWKFWSLLLDKNLGQYPPDAATSDAQLNCQYLIHIPVAGGTQLSLLSYTSHLGY